MDCESELLQQPLPQLAQAMRCLVGELGHDELFPLLDPVTAMAEQRLPLVAPVLLHQCRALSSVLRALPVKVMQELHDRADASTEFPPELPGFLQMLLVLGNHLDNVGAAEENTSHDQQASEPSVTLAEASSRVPARRVARIFRRQGASERQCAEPGAAAAGDTTAAAAAVAASESQPTTPEQEAPPREVFGERVILGPGGNGSLEEQRSRQGQMQQEAVKQADMERETNDGETVKQNLGATRGWTKQQLHVFRRANSTSQVKEALAEQKIQSAAAKGQLHVFRRANSTSQVDSSIILQVKEAREAKQQAEAAVLRAEEDARAAKCAAEQQIQECRELAERARAQADEVIFQLENKVCEAEDKASVAENARSEAEKKVLDTATGAQEAGERAAVAEAQALNMVAKAEEAEDRATMAEAQSRKAMAKAQEAQERADVTEAEARRMKAVGDGANKRASAAEAHFLEMVARAEEAEERATMAEAQARESMVKVQESQKRADVAEAEVRQMKVVGDEANKRALVAEDSTATIRAELEQASMKICAHEHHVSQLLTTSSLLKEEVEQVRAAARKAAEHAAAAEKALAKSAQHRSGFSARVVSSDALLLGIEAEEEEASRGDVTAEFGSQLADAVASQAYRLGRVRLPAGPVSLFGGTGAPTPVCASVTIANDGKAAWPATAVLALVDGAPFDLPLLQLGPVDPGETARLELDVSLPARAEAGTSRSSWVVSDAATGERFGPMLVLDVEWQALL